MEHALTGMSGFSSHKLDKMASNHHIDSPSKSSAKQLRPGYIHNVLKIFTGLFNSPLKMAMILTLLIPQVVHSAEPFGIVEHHNNASHIDTGIAASHGTSPFFPSRASTGIIAKVTADMFEEPEVCGGCHVDMYKQWNGSMHSNAWVDPIYRAALNAASKGTNGKVDKLCIGCHSPIGLVTGKATPKGDKMSKIAKRGVQCDVCHNISSSTGIGNGSYVLTPKLHGRKLKFGPFKDAKSPYHDTAYSELHTSSAFCGQCHNVSHPFNNLPVERTYDEWKDSWYAGQNIQCQDCHMTPGPGVTKNPGKATPFSKEREQIYTHYFVGGNVLVPRMLGAEGHALKAEEMLRAAGKIEIMPKKYLTTKGIQTISVKVTNIGAGHKLPTGFPEGREMWVDFKIKDAEGKEIYRLGKIEHGHTEEGTRSFKVVLGDKDGNIVHLELWDADRVLYDTRIPAKGYSIVDFPFTIPEGTKGPLTVTADLNYWSFPQSVLDELMGKDAPVVPVTLMTTTTAMMDVKSGDVAGGFFDQILALFN